MGGGAHHFGGYAARNHTRPAAASVGGHYDEGLGVVGDQAGDDGVGRAFVGGDVDGAVHAETFQAALFAAQEGDDAVVFGGGDGRPVASLRAVGLPVGGFGEGARQGQGAAGPQGGGHQARGGQRLRGQIRPVQGDDDVAEQRHNACLLLSVCTIRFSIIRFCSASSVEFVKAFTSA